ncbi:hypothetical protein GGS21DRAFT_530172 [Xylaria nigripes]|nr:hypothetical protein GGS21DRAFT_530172 [Xylaria nigripes]
MKQQPSEQIQSELESFRRQWREEVSSRSKNPASSATSSQQLQPQHAQSASASHRPPRRHEPPLPIKLTTPQIRSKTHQLDDEEDYVPAPVFEGDGLLSSQSKAGQTVDRIETEPKTALEFYEHAAERESTGKLGDSLRLYRKAFRMDETVDRKYRDKHFAGRWAKSAQQQQQQKEHQQQQSPEQQQKQHVHPSNAATTVPNTAKSPQSGDGSDPPITLSFPDLIASFAGLKLEGAPAPCEGVEPPPCPISTLPDEILVHILRDVAIADVADFMRLSQVCKRLAYIVLTEDNIWRRICLGAEFGFGGMHRHWHRSITWEPLALTPSSMLPGTDTDTNLDITTNPTVSTEPEIDTDTDPEAEIYTPEELHRLRTAQSLQTSLTLLKSGVYSSWQSMFRHRPRVRFGGCYISTVNYIRPGQNAGQHLTWGAPVHIVTYYRYLRLFRDGTAISLTTTDEPAHVVHHLKRENLPTRGNASHHHHSHHAPSTTSTVMSTALKGRWRLSPSASASASMQDNNPNAKPATTEGDLYIETEGVGPKYIYRMDLSLRSAGRAAARNNKLVWRGFWCYNKLTDDWGEFALKNDKPFFFSRVRSYGVGDEGSE